MKSKRILKFYFAADKLNTALDNIILASACNLDCGTEDGANRVIKVIEVKDKLSCLWWYLDGVINTFVESERGVLEFYGKLRAGIRSLDADKFREVKKVLIKFSRRARGIERFEEELRLLDSYYCLF